MLAQITQASLSDNLRAHLQQCMACRDTLALATGVALEDEALQLEPAGRYTYQELLGRGGQAVVLRVFDHQLGRAVALKELHSESRSAAMRFVREAQMIAKLGHPAILPVYDIGRRANGRPYYTMPIIAGRTLRQLVRASTAAIPWPTLLPHMLQAAEAVAHAHQHGIIHRDLTSANVLVGEFGETYVIDWGLARADANDEPGDAPSQPSAPETTTEGAVAGTPGYMSPEQLAGGRVDERVDVWGLGAILYESIWARPPGHDAPMLQAEDATVPAPLRSIVKRALERDREQRYPTVRALADDLKRLLSFERVSDHRYSTLDSAMLWVRRNRTFFRAGLVLFVGLLLALAVTGRALVRARDASAAQQVATAEAINQARVAREYLVGGYVAKAQTLLNSLQYLDALVYAAAAYAKLDTTAPASAQILADLRGVVALAAHQPVERVVARKSLPLPSHLPRIAMAWSPAGDQLAVALAQGTIVLNADGSEAYRLKDEAPTTGLAWITTTRELVVTNRRGLHKYRGEALVQTLVVERPRGVEVTSALFMDQAGVIAATDGELLFFDADWKITGRAASALGGPMVLGATGAGEVIVGAIMGNIEVWAHQSRGLRRRYDAAAPSTAATILDNGKPVLVDSSGLRALDGATKSAAAPSTEPLSQVVFEPRAVAQAGAAGLVEINHTGGVSFRNPDGRLEATSVVLSPAADAVGVAVGLNGSVALAAGSQVTLIQVRSPAGRPILWQAGENVDLQRVQTYQCTGERTIMQVEQTRAVVKAQGKRYEVVPPQAIGLIADGKLFDANQTVALLGEHGLYVWHQAAASSTYDGQFLYFAVAGALVAGIARGTDGDRLVHWRDGMPQPATSITGEPSFLAVSDDGSRLLLGTADGLMAYDATKAGSLALVARVAMGTRWETGLAWQGNWIVVQNGAVVVLDGNTLLEHSRIDFPPGGLNSVARIGDLLAVESMTELFVWRLTTMAPYASIKLPSTLGNLCLLDERGAIGAVDQAGSFQLATIEENLGSLPSMLARMRVVLGSSFVAEPILDEP